MSERVDIGHGVGISYAEVEGTAVGIHVSHSAPDGRPCTAWAPFADGGWAFSNGWTVDKREPLTLSPSIVCPSCGHHGFIRDGRWVPA